MNRNKIIGFLLATGLFAVLLKPAFIDISPEKPVVQLFAFIALLVGIIISGILTNGREKEIGH